MTREEWDRFEAVSNEPIILLAMKARCAEQGHDWEGCCSAMFHVYQRCKWCKEQR